MPAMDEETGSDHAACTPVRRDEAKAPTGKNAAGQHLVSGRIGTEAQRDVVASTSLHCAFRLANAAARATVTCGSSSLGRSATPGASEAIPPGATDRVVTSGRRSEVLAYDTANRSIRRVDPSHRAIPRGAHGIA